jgi:hypothetical protein
MCTVIYDFYISIIDIHIKYNISEISHPYLEGCPNNTTTWDNYYRIATTGIIDYGIHGSIGSRMKSSRGDKNNLLPFSSTSTSIMKRLSNNENDNDNDNDNDNENENENENDNDNDEEDSDHSSNKKKKKKLARQQKLREKLTLKQRKQQQQQRRRVDESPKRKETIIQIS